MNIVVNKKVLCKYKLSIPQFLYLCFILENGDVNKVKKELLDKNLVEDDLFSSSQVVLSNNTKDFIYNIIIESSKEIAESEDTNFEDIAKAIREEYPTGKKAGTSYQWRDSVAIITRKLMSLRALFGVTFTKEQAIKATAAYVKSFNGDYRYMQLLKYFILKTDKETKEIRSDFMSYIENEDGEDISNQDWTNNLI